MKLVNLISLAVLGVISVSAAAEPCEPVTITNVNSPMCSAIEQKAAQFAIQQGMLADAKEAYNDFSASFEKCTLGSTKAIRLRTAQGARGQDVEVLLTTELKCVRAAGAKNVVYNQFATVVTFWSNYEENQFERPIVKKLYQPDL